MAEEISAEDQAIESVDTLSPGDGIYSESSNTTYWVEEITAQKVTLEDINGERLVWMRETFQGSLESHTWVLQSEATPGNEGIVDEEQ